MARAPQPIRHPGIEQQGIHGTAPLLAGRQLLRPPHPQRLPQGQAQLLPQGGAALRALGPMQLHHVVAPIALEGRQIGLARIGHNQHPAALRPLLVHRRKQGRSQNRIEMAGRSGNGDHPDRVHPQSSHRPGLVGMAQAADLEQSHEETAG